jgi:hypothetical protein
MYAMVVGMNMILIKVIGIGVLDKRVLRDNLNVLNKLVHKW